MAGVYCHGLFNHLPKLPNHRPRKSLITNSIRQWQRREPTRILSFKSKNAATNTFLCRSMEPTGEGMVSLPSAPLPPQDVESSPSTARVGKILWSDVVASQKRTVYFGRKWTLLDAANASVVFLMHVLSLIAPFYFTWPAFRLAVGLYVVTGLLGITLSYHRNLSHRSFRLPKWLEYTFAYCGAQAIQGNPIDWVSTHRHHHQHCDSPKDPHSPLEGFWFSHMSWLFDNNTYHDKVSGNGGSLSNVGDMEKQPFYRFLKLTYMLHPLAMGLLLYFAGGIPFIAWGMGVRVVFVYHITWFVNSACHVWGTQKWNTGDLSRNNWWVAVLAFGEGWHNNHHAFEHSARHGLEWWQVDMTWYVVKLLQTVGLAHDVKLPTTRQIRRMSY